MKQKSLFNFLFLLLPLIFRGQSQAKFEISPYFNGITTIKDGFVEAGAEFNKKFGENSGKKFRIVPFVRLPLTDAKKNLAVIDRYTSSVKGVLSFDYEMDNTRATGPTTLLQWGGQVEYGNQSFSFYPTGDELNESEENHNSYSGELRFSIYRTKGQSFAPQSNIQLRVRLSNDYNESDEVQVIHPPNSQQVVTISNLIIDPPYKFPTFSPALLYQKYPGKGPFSFTTAFYYDMRGKANQDDPFNNAQRGRLEYWIFYFPKVSDQPNIKIGIGPFVSVRVKGTDRFKKWEEGAQLSVKFNSSFLKFF